jgi:very-short-patch-repair endonuclease
MKKLTTELFIKKSKIIHEDKYDYSLVEYVGSLNKVKIICPIHGVFEQTPNKHYKNGCPYCGNNIITQKELIKIFNKIHNNKYEYSLIVYKNMRTKIKIICPEHGIFEQSISSHKNGNGCPKCKNISLENFIKESKKIHNNKYDYTLVNYFNWKTKVKIICPEHGIFEQRPNNHKDLKQGCPYCNESHGEKEIASFLEKNKIIFIRQHKFNNCKNILPLPFDFYLPELNICIEYDGEQHFRKHNIWGENKLKQTQKNDKIKNQYCKDNNIGLIRIKFDQNIKEQLIKKFIIVI